MSFSHLNQTLTRIVTSAYLGLSRHVFWGPGGVHHLFKLHLQAIWLLLCGCHPLRCWSDHLWNSKEIEYDMILKNIVQQLRVTCVMDAFVPACVGARPAQIRCFLDLLFFLSSKYGMLLMKSHITYLLSAESMPNHAEIYANWGHCEDQLTAKNMDLSKDASWVILKHKTLFTSFALVIFLNLTENSSRLARQLLP